MILVICAVAAELRGFARAGVDVVAVGVGPVEAATGTARALAAGRYRVAINAGIGGGFSGRAGVGLSLPDGVTLADTAAPDAALLERLRATAHDDCRFGTGITSATITTSAARAAALNARYEPAVESMEGFAVLRAAALAGVPAAEVRGISNIVGDRATSGWNFRAGAQAAVALLTTLLDALEEPS